MNKVLVGALIGLAATGPMTLAMKIMHKSLPKKERYPLPPRAITMKVAEETGIKELLDQNERYALTVASHFAFGSLAGALYVPVANKIPMHPVLGGVCFGLGVWATSYMGWIPAMGILRPATEHPPRRTGLMIAAHVVWGATAGMIVNSFDNLSKKS
jgi:uncharacterized membrane protein YagU involved in acid resistance